MAELVTCPRCKGTGEVRRECRASTSETSPISENITKVLKMLGVSKEEKRDEEFTTCPDCNGFGLVRG